MPIQPQTPIEEQASWRLFAGIVVVVLFATLCFLTPVYVIANAQDGGPVVWTTVLLLFWLGGIGLLFSCVRPLAELRTRRRRSSRNV